jgi:hypothetical protein
MEECQTNFRIVRHSSDQEVSFRDRFVQLFKQNPLPDNELLTNLGLFLNRQTLSRVLFIHELYQKIVNVHGIVAEFGVRWGQNLALFESFRGMYEPYNYTRKIVGFDTFEGFPHLVEKDGRARMMESGAFGVTPGYEKYLEQVLDYHEQESPVSHMKKYELVKGDASVEITNYLERHPETIVALAYFDFDLYEPTKVCLAAIKDRLVKGSVIAFDELNCEAFPGETLAVLEVLGLSRYSLKRSPLNPTPSYVLLE